MASIISATQITGLAQVQKNFKKADLDGSGSISATEFEAAAKASAGLSGKDGLATSAIFQKLDTNSDKLITQAELTAGINLATQVQSVLLQGQELASGSAFAQLFGSTSNTPTSLFGGNNDYNSLTSSLLGGGSASTSLTSLLTGGNANSTASAGLFGGLSASTQALIQNLLARYTPAEEATATLPPKTA